MIARRRLKLGRALVWGGILLAVASVAPPWQLGVALGVAAAFVGLLVRDKAKQDIAIAGELGPAFELVDRCADRRRR